ncbi:MAG: bifunctional adenosylcobinamide kinase/adenosylcobinamide-phosphate guanylyltransferase [Eubacteriaceae bacterium]|nr:bifunctional adenosylcobinamide kinase/adenosylcobinamide-phosphate guanylyltransferase [Eubacteriaceae bacterium]
MILVFGGSNQGKREFVQKQFGINRHDMFVCSDKQGISYDNQAIANFNDFVQWLLARGKDPVEYVQSNLHNFKDKIIIIEDITSGIVPLGKETRAYREYVGKVMQLFSRNADEVYRVFCGIGEKLK